MSRANSLVEIWNTYAANMLTEKKQTSKQPGKAAAKLGTKPGPGAVSCDDKSVKTFQNQDSNGPANASNFDKPVEHVDTENSKADALSLQRFTNDKKFDEDVQKSYLTVINNNMKKSIFDQLYEEVTGEDGGELEALGIDQGAGEEGTEGGHEEGVTLHLSPEQAECLRGIISQLDGAGEESAPEGEDDGLNDETPPPEDGVAEEDENDQITEGDSKQEVLGTAITDEKKLDKGFTDTKGRANVIKSKNSTLAKNQGTGDSKVTDKITGDDKSFNAKTGLELIGKSNKVNSTKTSKVNSELFA